MNGEDADPLYKFLTSQKGFAGWDESHPLTHILDQMLSKEDPDYKSKADIKWNFTKFLISRDGTPIKRYSPTTQPLSLEKDIVAELSKPAACPVCHKHTTIKD